MTRPVAVVTGAAQGIGLEVARRLAATHRVVLLDLNADALPDAAAACGEDALYRVVRHHASRAGRRRRRRGSSRRPAGSTC